MQNQVEISTKQTKPNLKRRQNMTDTNAVIAVYD